MRTGLLVVAVVALTTSSAPAKNKKAKGDLGASATKMARLEARLARLEAELAKRPRDISSYSLPDRIDFCGESFDTRAPALRQRLETEFLLVLGKRYQVVLWAKRALGVFPVIEAQAKKQGACTDLKYLAVIESGLRSSVTSRSAAHGWWQFVQGSARQYGLSISSEWDERADLNQSTRAGLTYLTSLRQRLGSWPLAIVAYNTGPGRLGRAIKAQGTRDFWRLDLYTEAERYVPRVLAIKAVLEDLEGYGFEVGPEDRWERAPRGYVKVQIPKGREVSVLAVARGSGIDYRALRALNPELVSDHLPAGEEVLLEVPSGKEHELRSSLAKELAKSATKRSRKKRAKARKKARSKKGRARRATKKKKKKTRPTRKRGRKRYTIRAGDSLWSIAERHGVSVQQLRAWNKLGRRSVLRPGQRLVVRA